MLGQLSDDIYRDASVAPYYSSIGGHVRHSLDIYNCVLRGYSSGVINLACRDRNKALEGCRALAIAELDSISAGLAKAVDELPLTSQVHVRDDLGLGTEVHAYTFGAVLIQAHSHLLHHMAIIGYILANRGVALPDAGFGLNPTTPPSQESDKAVA